MISAIGADPEPAPDSRTILVGRDVAGHWLVQSRHGQLEGRFISRDAAWAFARAECRGVPGARLVAALHPLIPTVSFAPLEADAAAVGRAA